MTTSRCSATKRSLPSRRCLTCLARRPGSAGWTLVEVAVVLAIIALLFALLLPALQASRQAARQARCQLNLRGWAQAIHAYLAAHHRYPPAATWREGALVKGESMIARHSLFTFLLPFHDQGPLHQRVNFDRDWNDPTNVVWTKQWLGGILICPSAPGGRREKHPSDYTTAVRVDPSERSGLGRLLRSGDLQDRSGQGGPGWGAGTGAWDGLLQLDVGRQPGRMGAGPRGGVRPRDVLDGTSKTAMLFENAGKPICFRDGRRSDCWITRFRWASPTIWMTINDVCRGRQLMNCHNNSQPYGFHPGGIYLVFADGAVHWMSQQVAPDLFISAITRAGAD